MKTNFRLMAVTLTLLSASLAGCLGGDDDDDGGYSGPIDLVVYYESTSGMIESSVNNGQQGPTTGVTLSFDFADTTSEDGAITKITLDPDDGSDIIEADPSDDAVISYEWLTHGVFEISVGAEDEDGNTHEFEISVRVDMQIIWTETNTNSATMTFDATPDCEDGEPIANRITVVSTADNPSGPPWAPGGSSDVTWSLINPEEQLIGDDSGTVASGNSETWDFTTQDTSEGVWTLNVEVSQEGTNTDSVNVENNVTVAYAEGSEDSPNPRSE